MGYTPRFQPQLGRGSTSSYDCGPRTLQMGIDFLTRGAKRPGPGDLRQRMDKVGPVPTNIWDAERAVESFQHGGEPLKYWKQFTNANVKKAVKNGRYVHICVDYGKWNQVMDKTGSPSFLGGHSMGVLGQKRWNDGTVVWLVWDPLEDKRTTAIPQGPKWRPRWKVIKAMEAFAGGADECYAGVLGGGKWG